MIKELGLSAPTLRNYLLVDNLWQTEYRENFSFLIRGFKKAALEKSRRWQDGAKQAGKNA